MSNHVLHWQGFKTYRKYGTDHLQQWMAKFVIYLSDEEFEPSTKRLWVLWSNRLYKLKIFFFNVQKQYSDFIRNCKVFSCNVFVTVCTGNYFDLIDYWPQGRPVISYLNGMSWWTRLIPKDNKYLLNYSNGFRHLPSAGLQANHWLTIRWSGLYFHA